MTTSLSTHLVLLHLVLDVFQIRTKWLRVNLLNSCLCFVQPVCELLKLLVLQGHQDLMESGRGAQFRRLSIKS